MISFVDQTFLNMSHSNMHDRLQASPCICRRCAGRPCRWLTVVNCVQGSRIRSVRILLSDRYVRTLTYSILAYAYPRALTYVQLTVDQLVFPRYRLTIAGRRAFSCAGSSAWNSLPAFTIDETLTLDSFKRSLA